MLVSEFDFSLPLEQIAQQPPAVRGDSRMLALPRNSGPWRNLRFDDLPEQLTAGDVLVLNDSRVMPTRLFGRRASRQSSAPAGAGRVEALLTEQTGEWEWQALVRPGRKAGLGDTLEFGDEAGARLQAAITSRGEFGERTLRFTPIEDFFARLERIGHMPLPPYIRRPDQPLDRERYQTVFAGHSGSVAAPTAGLHFTQEMLERIRARGVQLCCLTLHVGLGTFQPVRVEELAAIRLHAERYALSAEAAEAVGDALRERRRVIAAGTTVVRTLEHCARVGRLEPHTGVTNIFISPGFPFRVVSGLLTNFHLPRSTLLMLVSAFAGKDRVLAAYRHAVACGYRFFSYGDCMFIA